MPHYYKGEPWFAPNEINFSAEVVYFILEHLKIFQEGHYPPDPTSIYTNSESQMMSVSSKAHFIGPAEIYVEISRRIDSCFPDCFLVYERYLDGKSEDRIARTHRMAQRDVERRITRVIGYCASGHSPRWVTIPEKNGRKGRRGVEYKDWNGHRWPK